jgi:transaldolase
MKKPLQQLADAGQSVWIDNLSRDLVQSGKLARLMKDDAVVGVTSNPTIFQEAMSVGNGYDDQLSEEVGADDDLNLDDLDLREIFLRLAARDVSDACEVLRPVFESGKLANGAPVRNGARNRDGFVSIEVDPTLAYDSVATTAAAVRLHALIDKPNLYVKIPATKEGLPAIEEMIANGKSINVTLIFSLQRYTEVAEAYLRGLERLVRAGGDPSQVFSVASFFVSRVDTEADRRLQQLGGHDDLKGTLAVANAKLAYARYRQLFSGERWQALEAKGASTQRCLWASTSTKDPAYSDVKYVEELIGPDTVNTMPESTLRAFQDHGRVRSTLGENADDAERVLDRFAEAGVDYADVTETLEREGVRKFEKSFASLLDGIRAAAAQILANRQTVG